MIDLVGTCPMDFWEEWIAEGDAAGDVYTGEEWGWFTKHSLLYQATVGARFYVVAHGRLRGWAEITRVHYAPGARGGAICRRGGAVACTIAEEIAGFRGLRSRWWPRENELPFPDWKTANVGTRRKGKVPPDLFGGPT